MACSFSFQASGICSFKQHRREPSSHSVLIASRLPRALQTHLLLHCGFAIFNNCLQHTIFQRGQRSIVLSTTQSFQRKCETFPNITFLNALGYLVSLHWQARTISVNVCMSSEPSLWQHDRHVRTTISTIPTFSFLTTANILSILLHVIFSNAELFTIFLFLFSSSFSVHHFWLSSSPLIVPEVPQLYTMPILVGSFPGSSWQTCTHWIWALVFCSIYLKLRRLACGCPIFSAGAKLSKCIALLIDILRCSWHVLHEIRFMMFFWDCNNSWLMLWVSCLHFHNDFCICVVSDQSLPPILPHHLPEYLLFPSTIFTPITPLIPAMPSLMSMSLHHYNFSTGRYMVTLQQEWFWLHFQILSRT